MLGWHHAIRCRGSCLVNIGRDIEAVPVVPKVGGETSDPLPDQRDRVNRTRVASPLTDCCLDPVTDNRGRDNNDHAQQDKQ